MLQSAAGATTVGAEAMLERARAMAPRFAERAKAAEEARRIPQQSVDEMLAAGFARMLLPPEIGGYGLGFETWYDVTRELSKADASHGWCGSLIIHHAHMIAQFPQRAQHALWADGLDVAVAASFPPVLQAVPADGGYRVSSKGSPFASGIDHSRWAVLGGMAQDMPRDGGAPEWKFFLVPSRDYTVRDTWFTAGMCATGSKTVVVEDAFVPADHVLSLANLRDGKTPGGALYRDVIFHTPFFYYAPVSFATPMLGAAQGAYELFREWTRTRKAQDGSPVAEKVAVQVHLARAAADLDAAELLLRRAVTVTDAPESYSPILLARSARDFARVAELTKGAIDTLIGLSGTAGFASSHPIQRAWRDIHFMAMHISMNPEANFSHFGRLAFGLPRDTHRPWF
jgi:alkylation response protein AidB-like acyl-CoA dehydrogenase